MDKRYAVKVAKGIEKAELVLKNSRIINVFSGEVEVGDIAIDKGYIVGIGKYQGNNEVDLKMRYVAPGFIDGHVHIESSMLTPPQFAKTIVPCGTTTIIADPHEIANVCGLKGIDYMIESSKGLPLDVFFMLPSCVPATEYENAGAILNAQDLERLINHDKVLGLGELMNYPGVINGNSDVFDKIKIAEDKLIDGHGPGLSGNELNAYVVAGIKTEHECTTVAEMRERLNRGMYILIREGSATRNLSALVKGVTSSNLRRTAFCTDDKHPEDISREGHINFNVKLAIQNGLSLIEAVQMATINTAQCYRLYDRGAIAPGYIADLVVLDENTEVLEVYKNGKLVAKERQPLFEIESFHDNFITDTVKVKDIENLDFCLKLQNDIVKVIQLEPHNIITKQVIRKVDTENGLFKSNSKLDILKLAVIERHHETGNIGLGLVEGYGLKGGAIGLTISHDSHNIIVIGDNDEDMKHATRELQRIKGGITICSGGKILDTLSLEIAGLMTDSPIEKVICSLEQMKKTANDMGASPNIDPFITLAFLALPVIPELKLTDQGLFDVEKFGFVSINVN